MTTTDVLRLYHYTSRLHLPRILRAGHLRVTESNLSRTREHAGPDVVWLTTDPMPTDPDAHGLLNPRCDKTAVRFTVDLPVADVHEWLSWSRALGITKRWAFRLEAGRSPETWRVVARPIPAAEWCAVEERPAEGWTAPAANAVA